MQLDREIMSSLQVYFRYSSIHSLQFVAKQIALGFGESSDGTAHRKITYKAHHATLVVPSYAPGVDDSDASTWTSRIRFVEVETRTRSHRKDRV